MQINRLKYFVAVARHGNFSAAAEELYTTQSAVSKQILALERELDVTVIPVAQDGYELLDAICGIETFASPCAPNLGETEYYQYNQ